MSVNIPCSEQLFVTHHGHINEAVQTADGHSRLGTGLGEGEQAGSRTSAQDNGCMTQIQWLAS